MAVECKLSSVGRNFETDASSLLQAWLQQPDMSSPWVHKKRDPQIEETSPVGLEFPEPIYTADDDYNFSEWNATAPPWNSDDGNAWPPKDPRDSDEGMSNLCMHGRLVPQFFLVGVMKAATTTFAANFRQSAGVVFPKGRIDCAWNRKVQFCFNDTNAAKEGHFFDYYKSLGSFYMASRFPKCRTDVRLLATDETPRYLMDPQVPYKIQSWYGPDNANKLKFIIIFREPVARFQSDFYHARTANYCWDYKAVNFSHLVDLVMTDDRKWAKYVGGKPGCHDRLEGSLYPLQMRRWFDIFDPSQFIILPFLYVVDPARRQWEGSIYKQIWNSYGLPDGGEEQRHLNSHTHPPLNEDISLEQLEQFKARIYSEHGPHQLASVFTEHRGASLYGYFGANYDTIAIKLWLQSNW